ncbi:response regulator receiver protein [Paraburkholderia sp. Tr-20389]|uniref:response regulator receiver protein n=1 Tax=Paraburkholderia sp. Tr-20389 TaxID=2703903 RepID=UPI00198010CB|nr:response regulator receiver protein [Paraburkholderia sp. Tr-20389]MBN3756617.1 response regulator receiver protein [Paraburkholderia sp. Tr-20389]
MFDAALLRKSFAPTIRQTKHCSSGLSDRGVGVVPCALVYIETDSAGSPNCTSVDPFCYLEQAITLNRSLKAVGLPTLTVATNVAAQVVRYLEKVEADARPHVIQLSPSTLTLSKMTRFYSAHFKLDMMEQLGATLREGELLMVLDTDMLALRPVDEELLLRCQTIGVGAFDISDQEFSAYGDARVIADLETVAGSRLQNPRWFGGEILLASAGFIAALVPRAHACFERYTRVIHELNHNGDEAFISAALNLLADDGFPIIDLGAHRAVGRHWSGNTHRDLRWFKGCSLLHLPGCKRLLERQARRPGFSAAHVWRSLVLKHEINRTVWPLRRWVRSRVRPRLHRRVAQAARVDVLVLDPDAGRLSQLVSRLTSHGVYVMSALTTEEARNEARRLNPRVIVSSSPRGVVDAGDLLEALDAQHRPVMIAFSTDDARLDWAQWDTWFPRSADLSDVVQAVTQALGSR